MTRALPRKNGPRPAASAAVPGRSIFVFAVTVSGVAPPARACRQAGLQRRIHSLETAQDSLVLRPAKPIPDELEKLGSDGAFCRAVVWIAGQQDALARCRGA